MRKSNRHFFGIDIAYQKLEWILKTLISQILWLLSWYFQKGIVMVDPKGRENIL